jgi:deazaflavin-dependent oxidoreductase (nitroreductase family)
VVPWEWPVGVLLPLGIWLALGSQPLPCADAYLPWRMDSPTAERKGFETRWRPIPSLTTSYGGSAFNDPPSTVLRSTMSTPPADFNAQIIEEFHANHGRVGGMFEGMPLLLLHHTGAKSGKTRINPLACQIDDDRYVVFASKAGAPTNPDWYHNLKAHPNVKIEVGTDTIDVVASEATGDERERLYRTQAERVPQFVEYEKQTERVIPVIVLTPANTA